MNDIVNCKDCFYFKNVLNVKTCGLFHKFLKNDNGCNSGSKNRDLELEELIEHVKL